MTSCSREIFGHFTDGRPVHGFSLSDDSGASVSVLEYGGILQKIMMPDREGVFENVVLCYEDLASYLQDEHYLGAIVGRVTNRIDGGKFVLDGRTVQLSLNRGSFHQHGGFVGLSRVLWNSEVEIDESGEYLVLNTISPAGDEGYPGELRIRTEFRLAKLELEIRMIATTDAPTIINLTQHPYFNLHGNGEGDILDHDLQINAQRFLPVNERIIPIGEERWVTDTAFDFCQRKTVGQDITSADTQLELGNGFDHHWIVDGKSGVLRPAATLSDSTTGRQMNLLTTAPGVQLYTGNGLEDGSTENTSESFRRHQGLCLEPQAHPDAPNHGHFPSIVVKPGEPFTRKIIYRFTTDTDVA